MNSDKIHLCNDSRKYNRLVKDSAMFTVVISKMLFRASAVRVFYVCLGSNSLPFGADLWKPLRATHLPPLYHFLRGEVWQLGSSEITFLFQASTHSVIAIWTHVYNLGLVDGPIHYPNARNPLISHYLREPEVKVFDSSVEVLLLIGLF